MAPEPMTRRIVFSALILLIAGGALAIRLPHLADRPMHNDEGVNASKFQETYEHGTLRYDPHQYHGPALWFFTLPIAWLSGHRAWIDLTETNYRLVCVACGVGVVLSLLLMGDAIGSAAAIWAAIFISVSPAMVYYSRDYIHEMMLIFFTTLAIASAWRWSRRGRPGWAVLSGASIGLMLATKETTLVIVAAMFAGLLLAAFWGKYGEHETITLRPWLKKRHISAAIIAAIAITILLYSSFLRDLSGLGVAATFFQTYASRAAGQIGHVQPPSYYLRLLLYQKLSPAATPWWSEGVIVGLACIGTIKVLFFSHALSPSPGTPREGRGEGSARPAPASEGLGPAPNPHPNPLPEYREREQKGSVPFQRFIVFYTFAIFSAFSLISYKTPWNVLSPLYGMCLLAGIGAGAIIRAVRPRMLKVLWAILIISGIVHLAVQAYRASYVYAADLRNPYVYGHTVSDALKIVDLLEALARLSPDGHHLGIQIGCTESAWPLPWYLRRFDRVYYYDTTPPPAAAAVVIASSDLSEGLDSRILDSQFYEQANSRGLRPGVVMSIYIRKDLWKALMAERSRQRTANRPK